MTRDVQDFANGYYFVDEPSFDGNPTYTVQQPTTTTVGTTPPAVPAPPAPPAPRPASASTIFAVTAAPIPVPIPRSAPTNLPVPAPVAAARFAASDYAAALRALLPRGRAWPADPSSPQSGMLLGIAASFERSDAAANAVLGGSLPGQVSAMLPEWEATLGLPDPCGGDAPTIAQRLSQVKGRFVGVGGQSRQRYINFAAALGFIISITNYAPFRVGFTPVDSPVSGDEWTFVWGVTVTQTTGTLDRAVLECELQSLKPAESTLIFLN